MRAVRFAEHIHTKESEVLGTCNFMKKDLAKWPYNSMNQDAGELLQPAEQPVRSIATPGDSSEAVDTGSAVADRVLTQATSDITVCINFQRVNANVEQGVTFII
ncbi:hypothetical protein PsorP6_009223 [Peronosclerospora sorghi]|uniref:Uncharacterized protein n=1 Tax=Peronosclerospora sorghi TaxID=230839 RepID=A0ACC0VZR5_9STRA|nr:hypothetical protein PsorP6_009223 [Peronosclerospora sorghi]